MSTHPPYTVSRCPCGSPHCRLFHLEGPELHMTQGSGFTSERTARYVAAFLNLAQWNGQFDEEVLADFLSEAIDDSIDMDWQTGDASKSIMRRLAREGGIED